MRRNHTLGDRPRSWCCWIAHTRCKTWPLLRFSDQGCSWSSCSTLRSSNKDLLVFHLVFKTDVLTPLPRLFLLYGSLGTDRLCSRWGSGDAVLKFLRISQGSLTRGVAIYSVLKLKKMLAHALVQGNLLPAINQQQINADCALGHH